MSPYVVILFGVVILLEALTSRIFLNTSEAGDSDTEGFVPRWYHRLAFALLGLALIGWGGHSLLKAP
jgi:hypothetical protein